ncbi:MATE family efflux transporter [Cytobacillus oceanisediminis]|uniref:MATE family efflux transporter n=1 Tax=Cytobacillus oceanisediminis TaxID=665099 RepID=UPI0023DC3ECA|nr:MATE family efflux transporter [Cytobacillus oceanisediminis]MDF2036459.1 MATE family efflux transporter [Cytobacillus oceanisediminis]
MVQTLRSDESNSQILKTIFFLAMPAVIENFFQTILGFVDTLFVSKLGLIEVSAVGITNAILAVYFAVFMSIGVAANVFIAKFQGAGNKEKAKEIGHQSIILAIILGVLFGLISFFLAEPLLRLMGVENSVLKSATSYFQIVATPSIFISLMFVMGSILRGNSDTKTPMKISIYMNLIHIVLDYILIFGFFFIPALGLEGAAYATVIARILGVIGLSFYLLKYDAFTASPFAWKINKQIQWNLITLGAPAAGERLVMRIGQVLYFGMIVALGTNTFAAHQIAGNIEVFSYMIGYGFAAAATTLVGQRLGAADIQGAKRYANLSILSGAVLMTIFGVFLFMMGEWAAHYFTDDVKVVQQIKLALQIDAFIQPVLAAVLILKGVYQAAENTKFPMYSTAIGIWIIRTAGVYLLGVHLGFGIAGVWIAIGLDNLYRAIWLGINYRNGRWLKYIKINESSKGIKSS